MLQVGITGGIGAGKSLVARIFNVLGIPVYNADERAKWLMSHDQALKEKIVNLFGSESYQNDNLNKSYLAQKVFPNPDLLEQLNATVHPAVGKDYQEWITRHEESDFPYTLKEAALMFETGSYQQLDFTILVHASQEIRLRRVLLRDTHRSKEQVLEIMKKQMPEEQKVKKANFIIENDYCNPLIPQVLKIDHLLKHSK